MKLQRLDGLRAVGDRGDDASVVLVEVAESGLGGMVDGGGAAGAGRLKELDFCTQLRDFSC